jgi:nitroimidazol reductase NimA-like FMN-containing flavoprotein (pyridoxamine 5'-phosphate oxidase superfamily)
MRNMKDNEIDALLEGFGWATLCMVDPDARPYAIEFSYFLENGDICGLVHPRGKTAECLASTRAVCVKICDSDAQCRRYRAVSCFGIAAFEKLTNPIDVARAWDNLEEQLQLKNGEYSGYKKHYLSTGKSLPLLRIMVSERSGVTISPRNEPTKKEVRELASAVD